MFKYARTRSYNGEGLSAELKTVGRADTPAVVLLGTSTQDFVGEESFVNQQTANEHLSTEEGRTSYLPVPDVVFFSRCSLLASGADGHKN